MSNFVKTLEIGDPERVRIPEYTELKVYSREMIQKSIFMPVEDGVQEWEVWVEDTLEWHHKARKEQRHFLGIEEAPPHPLEPTQNVTEVWRIPYRFAKGEVKHIDVQCGAHSRAEALHAVKADLIERYHPHNGEYQLKVTRLKSE